MSAALSAIKVAYLGPVASFSHQAAIQKFTQAAALLPHSTFFDIFTAVQSSAVHYAVLPVENSTNGSVIQALDLLADRDGAFDNVKICDEVYVTVHHCLMTGKSKTTSSTTTTNTAPYSRITKLYTHPQAWGQCRKFLQTHFRTIERQDVSSTSRAADIVSNDPDPGTSAAIASRFAGEMHNCEILAENIEDAANNTTRFLVLCNQTASNLPSIPPPSPTESLSQNQKHKTLISLQIPHTQPGALADALTVFKRHAFNLTSINSRPSLLRPWHYVFLVECDAPPGEGLEIALKELGESTVALRCIGTWKDMLGVS